jgi:hypothetical protein
VVPFFLSVFQSNKKLPWCASFPVYDSFELNMTRFFSDRQTYKKNQPVKTSSPTSQIPEAIFLILRWCARGIGIDWFMPSEVSPNVPELSLNVPQ